MIDVIRDIKKTIVFLGWIDKDGKPHFFATGFLVQVQGFFQLVTAKHVVVDRESGKLKDENMVVFFNSKDGRVIARSVKSIKEKGLDWIFHSNADVDIAIMPFPVDTQHDDIKMIPDKLFTPASKVYELYDIFFLSYQPGIEPRVKIQPVFRTGVISVFNEDKTFYIDAAAFPGNSGSPVFLKPSPIRFDIKGGIALGGDPLGATFVGVIGEYVPYQEVAISVQTKRPRVIFEENTGFSKVWPVEFIEEMLNSDTFKKQLEKIKASFPAPASVAEGQKQ